MSTAARPPAEVGRQLGGCPDVVRILAYRVAERSEALVFRDHSGEVAALIPAAEYRALLAVADAFRDE
jgi:hypothetical protein